MTLFIAHRGDTISHPENTLEAFLSAFEKGADGVEMDIHLRNGEIVVDHDYLFDQNKTYPQLITLLRHIHNKGRIEIEVKSFSHEILSPLKKILDKFPQADFELTTSEIPLALYIKIFFPQIPLGLILQDFFFQDWMTSEIVKEKIIGWGKMAKADTIHLSLKILKQFGGKNLVDSLHKSGFLVHSHILNTEQQKADLEFLSQCKVNQCTFDNLELVTKK